eukprot:comp24382_c0_seq1/m.46653 comp24382_c0_seq1/g.46653  ORF comp24382_c0_seq1/g.46653 comp24382_c0_seq1/m.46653 type:complete len:137 (-) comp24382_c0_seq1:62-472(-)
MSADLQWEVVKSQSSFLVKRNGLVLTREPNNLTQLNARKYSGLVNKKAAGITAAEKGIVLSVRTKAPIAKPKKAFRTVTLNAKNGSRRVLRSVAGEVPASLKAAALKRATQILLSQKAGPKKAGNKTKRTKKATKA